jgi:glycosyltransferase involved in cell wall biosynthesis
MTRTTKLRPLWISTAILDLFLHNESLLSILKELSDLGHEPSLIAVRSKNKVQLEKSKVNILAIPLRFKPVLSPLMFSILVTLMLPFYILRSKTNVLIFDPDIHIVSSFSTLLLCKLRSIKLILDIRSVPVEISGFRGFLRNFFFLLSIEIAKKTFDGFTIITPSMKRYLCTNFDIHSDQVGVWTSGVDEKLFNPEAVQSDGQKLRRNLALTDRFIIFYHGVLTPTRGLLETVNAMKLLISKHPNFVFTILGTGPFENALTEEILKLELQEHVMILKPVNIQEVPKYISMCDVSIVPLPDHPYWRFQSPLKLLEYLSMTKVVILTDIEAHRVVVGKSKCGIYISSIDPAEIAKSIDYAFENRNNLLEWGKLGRVIINDGYTWKKVAINLEDYLLNRVN